MEAKKSTSVVKWLVIGFLGSLGLLLTFVIVLVLMFSPVIRVDEPKGKVVILGGLIEITGKKIEQGKEEITSKTEPTAQFDVDLKGQNASSFFLNFNAGDLTLKTSPDTLLKINCENPLPVQGKLEKDQYVIDLASVEGLKCTVAIPEKMNTTIKGVNGKVAIDAPRFDLQVKMVNAKMSFAPASGVDYKFNNSVGYGTMDQFASSEKKEAFKISLSLVNGALTKGN